MFTNIEEDYMPDVGILESVQWKFGIIRACNFQFNDEKGEPNQANNIECFF